MRISLVIIIPLLLLAMAAPPLMAQEAIPRCTTVEPLSGKVGTEIVVTGENIGKDIVAKLYLTDGKNDIELVIGEHSATNIKTKIPASAKVGER